MHGLKVANTRTNQAAVFSIQQDLIRPEEFRPDEPLSASGSRICFDGTVRDHHDGKPVLSLEYSAFEEMCGTEGLAIVEEALDRFQVYRIWAVHRYGLIPIGESALWVEVESAHRGDGFRACEYVIDEIKRRLPVWKFETYGDGSSEWVYCRCT